ncbi:MAG TPA: fluoride efflux transporter CrcB [Sphingomicrobium sp.]
MNYLLVFIGGGLGAALRHGVNKAALAHLGPDFPYGTFLVNVLGGLLMGIFAELFFQGAGTSQGPRLFLSTGLLGGFTTFSAFSLEAGLMWQRGDYVTLSVYAIGSVVLSIVALFAGMAATRSIV